VKPEIENALDALPVERFRGEVKFRDVGFSCVPGVPKVIENGHEYVTAQGSVLLWRKPK